MHLQFVRKQDMRQTYTLLYVYACMYTCMCVYAVQGGFCVNIAGFGVMYTQRMYMYMYMRTSFSGLCS